MNKPLLSCFLIAIFLAGFIGLAEKTDAQSSSTLVHYWYFPEMASAVYNIPNVPNIYEDFDATGDTTQAYLEYYLLPRTSSSYAGYLDGVACVDSSVADHGNARNGVGPAGWALRVRNPVDSIELRWHMPTTGYTSPVITYALESSSTTSGDSTQVFSYSVDGGKTWKSADISVNGVNVDTLSVANNAIYQGTSWGLVVITFGSDDSVNNNPNFIFRITYRGNISLTKGNNRFADVTMDGDGKSSGPQPAKITLLSPGSGNILVPNQVDTIQFTTYSTVGQVRTIKFSSDSGLTWSPVGTVTGGTSYVWTVPNIQTNKGLIQVTDSANVTGLSTTFVIYPITPANRIVHYWDFNTLGSAYHNPNIPALPADFSATPTHGSIVYVIDTTNPSYAGYIDNVAGDTTSANADAQFGEPAGQALRVRNPTHAMELHFVIPTTGYSGINLKYSLQSSSLSGPQVQHFSYSTDGGLIWIATGMTVNGADSVKDTLDVTQLQYQGTLNGQYGLVTIGFNSQAVNVDNNPNFVFRILFGDTATTGTSGNNRFDNFSVLATNSLAGVNEPSQQQPQLAISPNPAMDEITFENPYSGQINVSVLNILGQEVLRTQGINSSKVEMNTSALASGSYYVHVQNTTTGTEQVAKFVKQ